MKQPLAVAWISDFQVEWLRDVLKRFAVWRNSIPPRGGIVLLAEFEKNWRCGCT